MVDGVLRYARSQTALLDALLLTLPEADVDATFEKARNELRSFEAVKPADPPRTFRGTLREYQREGLGWLHFLRTYGLGGCLADDMGLGKTVQVLALLDSRRGTPAKPSRPSIVVVPRSLVFNWVREAERFTPRLRLLDFSGPSRRVDGHRSKAHRRRHHDLRHAPPRRRRSSRPFNSTTRFSTRRRRSRPPARHRRRRRACSARTIAWR